MTGYRIFKRIIVIWKGDSISGLSHRLTKDANDYNWQPQIALWLFEAPSSLLRTLYNCVSLSIHFSQLYSPPVSTNRSLYSNSHSILFPTRPFLPSIQPSFLHPPFDPVVSPPLLVGVDPRGCLAPRLTRLYHRASGGSAPNAFPV